MMPEVPRESAKVGEEEEKKGRGKGAEAFANFACVNVQAKSRWKRYLGSKQRICICENRKFQFPAGCSFRTRITTNIAAIPRQDSKWLLLDIEGGGGEAEGLRRVVSRDTTRPSWPIEFAATL